MDIKKFKELMAKMPEQGFKGNMFVGKKKPEPKTPIIRELAKEWGIPVKEYNIKELDDFDALDFPKNMSQEEIKKGLEKFGLKGSSPEDVGNLQPLEKIDENAPTTKFDTQAFFANKNSPVMMFLDEMTINGITGETFTNGENN
jgi:hypothetical protein